MNIVKINNINSFSYKGKNKATNNKKERTKTNERNLKNSTENANNILDSMTIFGKNFTMQIAPANKKNSKLINLQLDDIVFKKGRAHLPSGKRFSGNIITKNKNGVFSITFENGLLSESSKLDPNGKVISSKTYTYKIFQDKPQLKAINSQTDSKQTRIYFEYDYKGGLEKIERFEDGKMTTFEKNIKTISVFDTNIESYLYTTGLRKDMPCEKTPYGTFYPSCDIIETRDSKGNHEIVRYFENGMKDILNLDKQGTTGTIKHYDENNNLVSTIKRTFKGTTEEIDTIKQIRPSKTITLSSDKTTRNWYDDVHYDLEGNIIPTNPKGKNYMLETNKKHY